MNIMFFLKPKSELAYIYDYHTLRQAMEIMNITSIRVCRY